MIKLTEPPWRVHKTHTGRFVISAGEKETPLFVAMIPENLGGDDKERESNAKLIAAAPELLILLEATLLSLHTIKITQPLKPEITQGITKICTTGNAILDNLK